MVAPTDYANLKVWYDPSDTGSIIDAGAGAVSQLNDLSGNGYHLTQGTAGDRPVTGAFTINSLNVIKYDGSSDFLRNTSFSLTTTAMTWFAVFKHDTGSEASPGRVGSITNGTSEDWNESGGAGLGDIDDQGSYPVITNAGAFGTDTHVFCLRRNGTAWTATMDGASYGSGTGSSSAFSATRIALGCSANDGGRNWDGIIAECFMYSVSLSDTDRDALTGYLTDKWAPLSPTGSSATTDAADTSAATGEAERLPWVVTSASAALSTDDPSVTFSGYTPLEGDYIILFAASTTTLAIFADASLPAGWSNPLGDTIEINSDAHGMAVVYHKVTAGEQTAVTQTYTATNALQAAETGMVHGVAVRDAHQTDPIDGSGTVQDSANTVTPHVLAAITGSGVLVNRSLVISSVAKDATGAYSSTPAGWTQLLATNTNQGMWTGRPRHGHRPRYERRGDEHHPVGGRRVRVDHPGVQSGPRRWHLRHYRRSRHVLRVGRCHRGQRHRDQRNNGRSGHVCRHWHGDVHRDVGDNGRCGHLDGEWLAHGHRYQRNH